MRERVEVKTGSGVYVLHQKKPGQVTKPISAFELTQARALVEGEAAALAAATISSEELEALKQTLVEMKSPEKADEAERDAQGELLRHREAVGPAEAPRPPRLPEGEAHAPPRPGHRRVDRRGGRSAGHCQSTTCLLCAGPAPGQ